MAAVATQEPRVSKYGRNVEKISVAWTSDASGNASVSITGMFGYVMKVVTDPAAGGSAPTDNYDITLVDENGVDALIDQLLNRDTANTEQVYPVQSGAAIPVFVIGTHTFTVANAGDTKSGVATLYIAECL